jgi:hypothetical protein
MFITYSINAKGDNSSLSNTGNNDDSPLGILPHQIRGSVSQFSQITLLGQASNSCTACSETVSFHMTSFLENCARESDDVYKLVFSGDIGV